jgi:hypothetical protein
MVNILPNQSFRSIMNQLFKIMLIASFNIFKICAAADDSCVESPKHAMREQRYAAIWAPEGKQHAAGLCNALKLDSCDCKAVLCKTTVLATHSLALILIGVDYETGIQIIDLKSVPLENKREALKMLLAIESSTQARVLNAIAGLLREGANQVDGNATVEDLKKARKLYVAVHSRACGEEEGFRAAACLGDMYRFGELNLKLFGFAAIFYAAAGKYGVQDLKDMLNSHEITQELYDKLIQKRAEHNAARLLN